MPIETQPVPPVPLSSPVRSISKSIISQYSQLAPRLAVESFDLSPFSESFTGLLEDDIATSLLFPDPPETQNKAGMVADLSYDVEIKDIEHFAPRFRDGDIEEVMVISPKPRPIHPSGQGVKGGDIPFHRHIYVENADDFKLYTMRILNKERVRIRSSHDHIQLQMEICQEIRKLRSVFLSPFIWIYEDGLEIHSIAVEALDLLHTAGIIHRDLAPCNIMFDASGHVVITGFGQACRPDSAASFSLPDTGLYCAPELILGWAHDFSVDCWSFGLLMYMMLFGSHPYVADNDNDNAAILQTKVLHCSLMVPRTMSVSWTVQDLLVKCLERNAALRLDIEQIKAHPYFCTVNWMNVTNRVGKAPLGYDDGAPDINVRHSEDNVIVSEAKKAAVHTEDEPLTLVEEKLVDSFTTMPQRIVKSKSGSLNGHHDAMAQTQRRISSQSTRLEIVIEASDEGESLDVDHVESHTQDHVQRFRQPSPIMDLGRTPAEPLSLWDTLDLDIDSVSSHYSNSSTTSREEPRGNFGTLRKSRSVAFQDRARSSLSITSTVPSTRLHVRNKLRKMRRPASTPTLRSPHIDPLLKELPLGVKQIGYGIGFSPVDPFSSRSKSVYRSCYPSMSKAGASHTPQNL
ncbi:hypothetical protein EDD22DRAFT_968588 [Suillus occidentalis]|nr:hypothetical protein EDD22DRAFT_968588 [Suillus occidentalis]